MTLICAKFDADVINISKVTSRKTKCPGFFGIARIYTVSQKNPCDYVFDDNLNSKWPIVIIFGTIIT